MKNRKKFWLTIFVVLVVLFLVGIFYLKNRSPGQSTNGKTSDGSSVINFEPPTKEESEAGDRQKQNINSGESTEESQKSNTLKPVKPLITSYGQTQNYVEVAARVSGILEDGGTCTLQLVKNGNTVKGQRIGLSNVSEVSCGFIKIPRTKLSPGIWEATVLYSSPAAYGTSLSKDIQVL